MKEDELKEMLNREMDKEIEIDYGDEKIRMTKREFAHFIMNCHIEIFKNKNLHEISKIKVFRESPEGFDIHFEYINPDVERVPVSSEMIAEMVINELQP